MLDILDRTFNAVFDGLNQQFKTELDTVREQHPFEDLRYTCPCLRFTYPEAMALLRKEGPALVRKMMEGVTDATELARLKEREASVASHGDLVDIGTEDEKLLGEIVARTHKQDFYIIDKFPADVRPFYTMPDPIDPTLSNSYDIFIRGEEVTSGAQRIHDPQMLLDQAAAKDPPVDLSPDHGVCRLVQVWSVPARRRRHRPRARRHALLRAAKHSEDVALPEGPEAAQP